MSSAARALILAPLAAALLFADSGRDFSGQWSIDSNRSDLRHLSLPAARTLTVTQLPDVAIKCDATYVDGSSRRWSYLLDGTETRVMAGDTTESSIVKWEGAALLVNTQVSGVRDYTVMDHWSVSNGGATLTISRQVILREGQLEGTLVYTRQMPGAPEAAIPVAAPDSSPEPVARTAEPVEPAQPRELVKQPAAPPAGDFIVARGTHIGLSLRNALDTKHTKEGDHVYLETIAPISVGGRIVIPQGSFVNGTVTESRAAQGIKKKGEMYIRFDSLVLPNGVTRDFRSRLVSADGAARGTVDAKEGSITGERDSSGDVRTVINDGAMGAGIGTIAGAASGHPLTGLGIGAAAGIGIALASIHHGAKPEATLPRGTILEMVLDRDLEFSRVELPY
jgi:type IV secretion system protein VirB10